MKNAMNSQQPQLKILHKNSLKQNYWSINAFSVIIHTISPTDYNSVLIHNKPYSDAEYGLFFFFLYTQQKLCRLLYQTYTK